MPKILNLSLGLILALSLYACNDNSDGSVTTKAIENPLSADKVGSKTNKLPEITFDKDFHDFGQIQEGEKVTFSFRFKNTGKGDLIIQTASGSCGCTVPEYPQAPLKPGETGFIKVQFNSEGRAGIQEKQVTLVTNAIPNTTVLRIKAEVNER